jgi:hypothetical protein
VYVRSLSRGASRHACGGARAMSLFERERDLGFDRERDLERYLGIKGVLVRKEKHNTGLKERHNTRLEMAADLY